MIGPRGDARSLAASRQLQSAVFPPPFRSHRPPLLSQGHCRGVVLWNLSAPDIQLFIYSLDEEFV